jgi:hypothetical protein
VANSSLSLDYRRVCGRATHVLRCTCTSPSWCAMPRIEPAWGTPWRHTRSRHPWLNFGIFIYFY